MADKKFCAKKEELERIYDDLKSMLKVAKHYGVSKKLILNYMNRYGISRKWGRSDRFKKRIVRMASQGKTTSEVSNALGIGMNYVRMLAKQYGVKFTDAYHGGYIITHNGYKMIPMPEHPEADSKGYIREHRVVMENMIGRRLSIDEVVHHKDGNKLNNNPHNLEVMGKAQHASHHHKGTSRRKRIKDIV